MFPLWFFLIHLITTRSSNMYIKINLNIYIFYGPSISTSNPHLKLQKSELHKARLEFRVFAASCFRDYH